MIGEVFVLVIGLSLMVFWGFFALAENPVEVRVQPWYTSVLVTFTFAASAWTFLFAPNLSLSPGFWGALLLYSALPSMVGLVLGTVKKKGLRRTDSSA